MPTRGPHVLAAAIGGLCLLASPAAAQIAFTEGGALFTLADMAFGLASNFGQEDGTMISTNATISYMKSAKTGPIVAEARLANGGRHLATYEVKIYDGQGTYIACAMISGYRLDTKLAIEE